MAVLEGFYKVLDPVLGILFETVSVEMELNTEHYGRRQVKELHEDDGDEELLEEVLRELLEEKLDEQEKEDEEEEGLLLEDPR